MSTLPSEIAEAFTIAVITTLRELVQVEASSTVAACDTISGPIVVATIQLLRPSPGLLSLVLPESVAIELAIRYLPSGTEPTPEMIGDVAGEIANVIAGQAKTMLKGSEYHFHLSTPTIARGLPDKSRRPNRCIHFGTEIGPAVVEIEESVTPGADAL